MPSLIINPLFFVDFSVSGFEPIILKLPIETPLPSVVPDLIMEYIPIETSLPNLTSFSITAVLSINYLIIK